MSHKVVSGYALDRLATFAGDVIRPSDEAYDGARRVWNAMIDRRPALIVRPTTVDDVVTALRFGRDTGLTIAVRSGGHSVDIQGSNDEAFGWGKRVYTKGGFANYLRPATLDALVSHLDEAIGENAVSLLAQGGAMAALDEDASAFTGRSARYHTQCESYWTDAAEDAAHIAWTRRAMDIVDADAAVGRYVNMMTDTDPALGRSVYGDAKMARLVAIKRAWDPDNVFRLNQNIDPDQAKSSSNPA